MRTPTVCGLALLAGLGLGARAARAETPAPDQQMTDLDDHYRHHQHGGITQFIELSLDTLGEDEARVAQVEKAQAALHECMDPVEAHEHDVFELLADGIAAGAIDTSKVKSGVDAVNATASTIHPCVAPVLNELHAALLPPERAELGDKVRAHWGVWRHVNFEAKPGGKEAGGRLSELAKELSLPADQVDKLSSALHAAFANHPDKDFDPDRVNKQVLAFAKAFTSTGFDANSVTTNSTAYLTSHGANRMALFYETILPLLTAAQRTTLAAHLREHAAHHPAVPNQ